MSRQITTLVAVLLFAIALYAGTAAAGGGPPNFTCDATHSPVAGAVYKNFTVNSDARCTIRAMSITIQGNLSDNGILEVSDFGAIRVNGNATVGRGINVSDNGALQIDGNVTDDGVVNVFTEAEFSPASLRVGGNVTVNGGDFNGEDDDLIKTSPITMLVGGNFTANEAYNIRFADVGSNPLLGYFGSVVGIAGHTTINNDHSQAIFGGGTFGSIEITNVNDPFAAIFLEGNTINGSVTLTNNNSLQDGVAGNTIAGDLTCSGNTPSPTNAGIPNSVGGHETGQCLGL